MGPGLRRDDNMKSSRITCTRMLAAERGIQRPFISAHSNSVGVTCHARTGRCHGTPRFSETRHWNCRRLRRAGDKRQGRAAGAAIDCRRSTAGRARNTGTASRGDQRGRSEPPAARTSALGSSLAPPLASPLAPASLGLAPPALAPPLASPSLVTGRRAAGPPQCLRNCKTAASRQIERKGISP